MPAWIDPMWALSIVWLLFAMAFGGCVGSLINVLVYRLPRGLSVVRPPSRCPSCGTQLTFRENFPVFGWLLLRGRCRFCRSPISPEYPLVEALTAVVFGLLYLLWYVVPAHAVWLGIDWGTIKPEWARGEAMVSWPLFVMLLCLVGSLIAMTLVDARTFTIPLVLTWVPAIVGIAVHTGLAAWVSLAPQRRSLFTAPGEIWAIPTPVRNLGHGLWEGGWPWTLAAAGAGVGLIIGNVLLASRLIGRSFADYEKWEREQAHATGGAETPGGVDTGGGPASEPAAATSGAAEGEPPPKVDGSGLPAEPMPLAARVVLETLVVTALGAGAATLAGKPGWWGGLAGLLLGPILSGVARRARSRGGDVSAQEASPADAWVMYPHARREMVREMAFLAPAASLGLLGWYAGHWWMVGAATPPLWVAALAGSLLGYLVGGGVVWFVRIAGSLAFGKEAMGLGDVHLMAAVGACLGWIDATLAFFIAAFVGIYFVIVQRIFSGSTARAMPYGPYLAAATLLVILCKPLIEAGLSRLLKANVNIP
ncbi:MAG: A24 family peptidase [Phycisphaerales bacterium]|nr:A24 family peptidase [Phycisphaerales bacterium]